MKILSDLLHKIAKYIYKPEPIKFNMNGTDFNKVIGLNEDRGHEIFMTLNEICLQKMTKTRFVNKAEILKEAVDKMNIVNPQEYLFLGMTLENALDHANEDIMSMAVSLGGRIVIDDKNKTIN